MRASTGYKKWLKDEKSGTIYGVCLGMDMCAEHEGGIQGIKKAFGVENRHITKVSEHIEFVKSDNGSDLAFCPYRAILDFPTAKDGELHCYWNENSFLIRTKGDKQEKWLGQLWDAILNKDAMIWLGGLRVLGMGGLYIGITSKMPADMIEAMVKADQSNVDLEAEAAKINIKSKIDGWIRDWKLSNPNKWDYDCPLYYLALSPGWLNGGQSKYKVMYWLNVPDDRGNNYGWYTVEQLEEWLCGEGPIPKTERQRLLIKGIVKCA